MNTQMKEFLKNLKPGDSLSNVGYGVVVSFEYFLLLNAVMFGLISEFINYIADWSQTWAARIRDKRKKEEESKYLSAAFGIDVSRSAVKLIWPGLPSLIEKIKSLKSKVLRKKKVESVTPMRESNVVYIPSREEVDAFAESRKNPQEQDLS